jgi:hypothetical protein
MIHTYRPVFIHSRHIPVSRYAREFILLVSIPFIIRFERIWNVNKSLIWMKASPWTGQYLRTAERQTWLSKDMQCDSRSFILKRTSPWTGQYLRTAERQTWLSNDMQSDSRSFILKRASPWTGQYLRTAERQTWLSNDMQSDWQTFILKAVIIYHLFLAKCSMYTYVWIHGRSRLCLPYFSVKETTMKPRW